MGKAEVQAFYDSDVQKEWDRLDRHAPELLLTTYVFDQYTKPGESVLDLGGGPCPEALSP